MKHKKARIAIGVLAGFIALVACSMLSDVRSTTYEHYEAVVAAGEIERGWVPEFLPRSSTNIHVQYDLDTNATLLAFDFAINDLEALTQACTPTEQALAPALSTEWWPDDLLASNSTFFHCEGGYLAINALHGYYWSGAKTISVAELDAHPEQYQHLDGQRATVAGYVDFDNIHDTRETYYDREALGFVRKPGQTAESVFFANFASSDPHPLFDRLYRLRPKYEAEGLLITVTGTLHAFEMPMNFSTDMGYYMDVQSLDDVVVLE